MAKYRDRLPQLGTDLFLTDGGIETTLVFQYGVNLPLFAAFPLVDREDGRAMLRRYFDSHASIANEAGLGFVLESPTWRASRDWAAKLGIFGEALARMNRQSIALMAELRSRYETARSPMVISGCVGPQGDGYNPAALMSADVAEAYHAEQIGVFRDTDADMVTAITMTYPDEAIGIARAARAAGMPVAISFTVETDGRLPTGASLRDAIQAVDEATGSAPAYYMINCAHPDHFASALADGGSWIARLRGVRANASRKSHAELDAATELDAGDPLELGTLYRGLRRRFGHINVLGGCCGTDERHIAAICSACAPGRH